MYLRKEQTTNKKRITKTKKQKEINENACIDQALEERTEEDVETLENRDYAKLENIVM